MPFRTSASAPIARRCVLLLLALAACGDAARDDPAPGGPGARDASAAGAIRVGVAVEEDGEWRMPAKNFASTRFSGLGEIRSDNVQDLELAWTFSTGVLRGHEAAPIVVDNTMFIVTPHPNILYALDLTQNGALKWKYDPGVSRAARGVACCDVVNRGAVYDDGRVFFNTLDMHTVAVDAETGREVWKTKLGDISRGETMTMAPLAAKGKVFVGNSGGEMGVRGWITALDQATGDIAWRGYSTGPDSIVLIGDDFNPFYERDRAPNLGVTTWAGDQWQLGGGAVWGWISYDPELDLIYHGTSNPGVWNPALRPGDNKWATSIFARDPDTGYARWAYQFVPHDQHDFDGINESILLDMPIGGATREVLVRPERNGFIYVMDRATGEVISADTFGFVTWADSVDLKTGRPATRDAAATGNQLAQNVCPAAPGMKDWQPSAFSPRTGLLYLPHNNLCMDYEGTEANFIAGTPYVGAEVRMYPAPGGHRGVFAAWDPIARRKVWEIREKFPVWSGALVTAGDVAFYGTMDRWFKAVDARSGAPLWQFQTGSGIIGQPVSYRGPDGHQYVAILAGVGGWAGATALGVMGDIDPTAALGFANAMTDLPDYTTEGGMLYVFRLRDRDGAAADTAPEPAR